MRQWRDTNEIILGDLATLPSEDWCSVRYEDLVGDPAETARRLCAFAGVELGESMQIVVSKPLKLSRYTLTEPDAQKWRRNEGLFAPFLGEAQSTINRLAALSGETTEAE
jgi:lambda repressor-like predicted transcriptional regulator